MLILVQEIYAVCTSGSAHSLRVEIPLSLRNGKNCILVNALKKKKKNLVWLGVRNSRTMREEIPSKISRDYMPLGHERKLE